MFYGIIFSSKDNITHGTIKVVTNPESDDHGPDDCREPLFVSDERSIVKVVDSLMDEIRKMEELYFELSGIKHAYELPTNTKDIEDIKEQLVRERDKLWSLISSTLEVKVGKQPLNLKDPQ